MRRLVRLFAALVVLLAIVVAAGARLPSSHVAARRVRLAQPPERVFALITDFAQAPTWRTNLTRVEMLPPQDGRPMFREHDGGDAITYRIETLDAPRRLVTRIADPTLPFGGAWTYDLTPTPDGAGTLLTITEHGEVYNPLFRFLSRYVFGHHATMDAYLRALAAKTGSPEAPLEAVETR